MWRQAERPTVQCPPLNGNGWLLCGNALSIHWELEEHAEVVRQRVLALTKGCSCKKGSCESKRCKCRKSGKICSPGCKCRHCTNTGGLVVSLEHSSSSSESSSDDESASSFEPND
eukprot:scpid47965/ scgid17016/ 